MNFYLAANHPTNNIPKKISGYINNEVPIIRSILFYDKEDYDDKYGYSSFVYLKYNNEFIYQKIYKRLGFIEDIRWN